MLPLLLALLAPPDLRLESVRESLVGTHCRDRVYVDALPTDDVIVRPCDASFARVITHATFEESHERWFEGRRVRRRIVYDTPLEPYAEDVDVETGVVARRIPLFYRATSRDARVFRVNPVVATNDATLQDRNDAASAVPSRAYIDVKLQDVEESGPLRGPYAALIDRQLPNVAPPDAGGSLVFEREQDGFEDVHAYFHIDASQRYVHSLGYTGSRAIAPYAIEIDAHATSGTDNSFFLPSLSQIGRGTLFFGEGGIDDAEDADLLVHEYGHALLEWIAPGTFGGANVSEARALGEGFGDYWAFSAHVSARNESGRDPFCFADWDTRCWEDDASQQCSYPPGSDCLRRLDSTATMADYERVSRTGVEHQNGTIWSSALREIHMNVGKTVADTIILEANFDAPAQPAFAAMARLLLRADRMLYGGTHADAICSAMTKRAILTDCGDEPRGERTLFASNDRNLSIEDLGTTTSTITVQDARAIERVLVRVDLVHGARGDLQIELVAPDGTTVVLQTPTIDRGTELHVTYDDAALDVLRGRSAAGQWTLRISDQRARDAGTLLSWSLQLQLAGDERVTERPRGTPAQMIPVVAHVFGANDTTFRSDVRLFNEQNTAVTATLIFTPSGRDGTSVFSAIRVRLDKHQTIALDDVVASAFGTSGSGSLQILGNVVAMSRMTTNETLAQQVPPNLDHTGPLDRVLRVASAGDANTRVNIGFTEIAGVRATVRFADREIVLEPYSHVQMPVAPGAYEIRAATEVVAYLSQIDNATSDAMFIPATHDDPSRSGIAPVISARGADRVWRSDLWTVRANPAKAVFFSVSVADGTTSTVVEPPQPGPVATFTDVLAFFLTRFETATLIVPRPEGSFSATRIVSNGLTQFVPLQADIAPRTQRILFIDTVPPYRTNLGIAPYGKVKATVYLYDAKGAFLETFLFDTEGDLVQIPITRTVANGRADVLFAYGTGRAYASVIDTRSGDATFVAGQ